MTNPNLCWGSFLSAMLLRCSNKLHPCNEPQPTGLESVTIGMFLQGLVRHGQGLILQPYCISTIHGGHVARAPMDGLQRSCKNISVVTLSGR